MSDSVRLPIELASFVGRERELALTPGLLDQGRLVTLTGAGGAGKSRLAIRVAADLASRFRHGPVYVELAPLSDGALIPQAILQALGVADMTGPSPDEILRGVLSDLNVLVVLDNCEHLIGPCARLFQDLLEWNPSLKGLATSREPLDIAGEVTLLVPPLTEPESIQLFGDRASAARPGFAVDTANAATIASICRHLDGLPLAIELAAARVRSMSPDEILARLDDRFSLLTRRPGTSRSRHATLRTALDWSHDVLSDEERVLFRRLSVFAGGWQPADAEAVCGDGRLPSERVIHVQNSLVDRSLVVAQTTADGSVRYRLLETVRAYADEHLTENGEGDELRQRHFRHFLAKAEKYHATRLAGGSDAEVTDLAAHRDNFRTGLEWAITRNGEDALRLTSALDDFWRMVSAAEGWRWLQRTLPSVSGDAPYRIRALLAAGMLAAYIPAYAEGAGLLREAAERAAQTGDRVSEAWAELWLGRIAFFSGDAPKAQAHLQRALDAHEVLANSAGLVRALCLLGLLQVLILGNHAEGEQKLERAVALANAASDSWGEGYGHMMLALCAAEGGELEKTTAHCRAALQTQALGPLLGVPLLAMAYASVTLEPARAMRILGSAAGHFQRTGTVAPPFLRERSETTFQRAERVLGAEAARRVREEGRAMTIEEAIDYSLSVPPAFKVASGLTRREAQIARLVARGATNREVATALTISVRTAESHVDHILSKLGLRNRTELGAWARENLAEVP